MAPYLSSMVNETSSRVCVRPDQGVREDIPMSKPSPSSKDTEKTPKDKRGIVSKSDSDSKLQDSNSCDIVPPRFSASGKCTRCHSMNHVDEAIVCNICDASFHAVCKNKRSNSNGYSICTKKFFNDVRPVIAKYGTNANRWGSFMFICNHCVKSVKSLKGKPSSSKEKSADVQNGTKSNAGIKSGKDQDNLSPEPFDKSTPNLLEHIGSLLGDLKNDILQNVHDLMDEKLSKHEAAIQEASSVYSTSRLVSNISPVSSLTTFDQGVGADVCHSTTTSMPIMYSDAVSNSTPNQMSNMRHRQQSGMSQVSSILSPSIDGDEKSDEQVIVLSSEQEEDKDFEALRVLTGQQLKDIPMNFLRCNSKTKKIIIGFPTKKNCSEGKEILHKCEALKTFKMSDAKKMMPKVTVTNVPNYLISHIIAEKDKDKLPIDDYRAKLKEYLYSKILEKNHCVRELVSSGDITFSIIYVNVGKDYSTLGIKVSPVIWNLLKKTKSLFIGNSKCPVTDRFNIKQCFKCQKLGHIAKDCDQESNTCMYCSASHMTSQCPNKNNCLQYRCINCSHSKNPLISQSCSTHHSGSDICPIIMNEKKRLQIRTEYSKNV